MTEVVIIGSGFGGLFAARQFAKRKDVRVTVISKTAHHLFQPLLYQVATGILAAGEIAPAFREITSKQDNLRFITGEVNGVTEKSVLVNTLAGDREFEYDYLINAAGAGQSYFGRDDFAQYAPGLKTIEDALSIRKSIFSAFERAEATEDKVEQDRNMTFVVVGSGATGCEIVAQLVELSRRTLAGEYDTIDPMKARIILVDSGEVPLAAFNPSLGKKAGEALTDMGVEIISSSRAVDMDADTVTIVNKVTKEKTVINATVKIWAAGVSGAPVSRIIAEQFGAPVDKSGRILVDADCSLPTRKNVFAIGDTMSLDNLPGVAQVAIQSGKHTAKNILRLIDGQQSIPFAYHDKGSMAVISRSSAVVQMPNDGMKISGRVAWLMWMLVHLMYLVGFRNRITTLGHWLISFVGHGRQHRTSFSFPPTSQVTQKVERTE